MLIRCALFGHKMTEGYAGGTPYLPVERSALDGIGRLHGIIHSKCERCGEKYIVCRIHIPRLNVHGNRIEGGYKSKW